jgi:hypothetical protein
VVAHYSAHWVVALSFFLLYLGLMLFLHVRDRIAFPGAFSAPLVSVLLCPALFLGGLFLALFCSFLDLLALFFSLFFSLFGALSPLLSRSSLVLG